jgi:uncharacterized protein YhdP
MKVVKFILYSFLATVLLAGCCGAVFWNLPKDYQNQIVYLATKKGLKYLGIDAKLDSASLDLSNQQVIFHGTELNLDEAKISLKQIKLQYGLLNKKLKLDLSLYNPMINGAVIPSQLDVSYLQSLDFKRINRDFDIKIIGDNLHGSCNLEIKNNKIHVSFCNFDSDQTTIKLSGDILRHKNSWSKVNLDADFQKLQLSSYKFLKTIVTADEIFALLDGLAIKGYASGHLKINTDLKLQDLLNQNNLSGEINFDSVELKYDPDFPIAQNIKAKAIINSKKMSCEIFSGNAQNLEIKKGFADFAFFEKDPVVNLDLSLEGKASCISSFLNNEQKRILKAKGIDLSDIKGPLNATAKVVIPIAKEVPTTINIKGYTQNFRLKNIAGKIDFTAPRLEFSLDRKHLVIEGSGSLNKYAAILKYEQDLPYTNSVTTAKIKIANLKDDPESLFYVEGADFLNVIYTNSNKGSKITANTDLSNASIKIPKIGFKKKAGARCLVDINSGKSMDDIEFKIYGHQDLQLKGSLNLNSNTWTLDSLNTDLFQDVKGTVRITKDQVICDLSGKYANLENADLSSLFKGKQSSLGLVANIQIDKIKLKQDMKMSDVNFAIKCDPLGCFQGNGSANIEDKKITVTLGSDNNIDKSWHITSQNAGTLLQALGIYNNLKNGQMDFVTYAKKHTIKAGREFKEKDSQIEAIKGKLIIDNFIITKTPFMANFLSLLSLSPEQIFSNEIKFNKLDASFTFDNDLINISDCSINGSSFDVIFKGSINLHQREIKLNGATFPSMYGINTVLKNTPIIGKLLYSKKRKGIIFTPFNISEKY